VYSLLGHRAMGQLGPEETGLRRPGDEVDGVDARLEALRSFVDAIGPISATVFERYLTEREKALVVTRTESVRGMLAETTTVRGDGAMSSMPYIARPDGARSVPRRGADAHRTSQEAAAPVSRNARSRVRSVPRRL